MKTGCQECAEVEFADIFDRVIAYAAGTPINAANGRFQPDAVIACSPVRGHSALVDPYRKSGGPKCCGAQYSPDRYDTLC